MLYASLLILLFGHAGMDAQVTYGFHHLRNEKPYLAQGPITNKVWLKFFTLSFLGKCALVHFQLYSS